MSMMPEPGTAPTRPISSSESAGVFWHLVFALAGVDVFPMMLPARVGHDFLLTWWRSCELARIAPFGPSSGPLRASSPQKNLRGRSVIPALPNLVIPPDGSQMNE
jgi:hypothetical protein